MTISELTPELLLSIPCPTCGVDAGEFCLLHSGGPSPDPHIDRKLDAVKTIEARTVRQPGTPE